MLSQEDVAIQQEDAKTGLVPISAIGRVRDKSKLENHKLTQVSHLQKCYDYPTR
jgi:hypothetical protein